jgi:geranylgeranyl diphosphate synthase, type II
LRQEQGGGAVRHSGPAADLRAFLRAEQHAVDAVLEDVCGVLLDGAPTVVSAPVRHALRAGGKRLRPILCVAAWRAASGSETTAPAAVYHFACALELIHTYSLMHDDLPCMDDDDLRRGQPTAHRVFGEAAAAAAGASLIPLAFRLLHEAGGALGLAEQRRLASIMELARGAGGGGMVGGQWLDLAAEGRALALDELSAIHAGKTGALFTAATRLGAVAAEAGDGVVNALGDYGASLGLAFQIADDVLDETGVDAVLGKTPGKDRAREKATYPALLGLDGARARAGEAAQAAVGALRRAGVQSDVLEQLAWFAVERDR